MSHSHDDLIFEARKHAARLGQRGPNKPWTASLLERLAEALSDVRYGPKPEPTVEEEARMYEDDEA